METNPSKPNEEKEPDVDVDEIDSAGERLPGQASAPEVPAKMENLTEWDQPPDAAGHTVPKIAPEDENAVAEDLVEEGIEEADRDQRMASADPDFEP